MLKTLQTIWLGRAARAEQNLETQNASLIIEQKIREAETGHMSAKTGLASLIARCRSEQKALGYIEVRIKDLETRTEAALEAGREELAMDAAKLLADLENERNVRRETLARSEEKAGRIKLAIEKTHRQLIDLRQGLMTAKSIEAERSAISRVRSDTSAVSALREGEAVLSRLLQSHDPVSELDALEEIEADLSGDNVLEKLSEAGFGAPLKVRTEDVLARFKKPAKTKS